MPLVLSCLLSLEASAQQLVIPATPLVFDGVAVVDVEQGRLLPGQRVVLTGSRIQAVGDRRGVPAGGGTDAA